MPKLILAINAGSSSVKVSAYATQSENDLVQLAEVEVSGLSSPPPKLKYTCHGNKKKSGENLDQAEKIDSQKSAFQYILKTLFEDKDLKELGSKDHIAVVAHRVVHGGDYSDPQIIDKETMHHIEDLTDLAPLHNASALEIVRACIEELPNTKNVAVFDSQFHQTIPRHVSTIPIDQTIAKKNKLKKYGFHGISYSFILRQVARHLKKETSDVSIIALHLGSGASACVIAKGKSINTSMSLTPLDGLPGATRSGSVDPSLVFHYASNVGKMAPSSTNDLHISKAEQIMNKESGWKALTGTTDFGEIAKCDTPEKQLAFDIVVDRVTQYIGSYYVSLQGRCDALVFAGGIGEKAVRLRQAVALKVRCLGFQLNKKLNEDEVTEIVQEIGEEGVTPGIFVVQTDEQYEMALSCLQKL